ncbi:MAG: NlpC/P60 family protein [Deltaproteobacteria bacterium]|nr:NlpC/P60 family protein [Deltaproteobacteria bacterium]
MSTLNRASFNDTLRGSSIKVADLNVSTAQKAELKKADVNGDGVIKGAKEIDTLFTRMDNYDHNGKLSSVDTAKAPMARMTEAIATAANKPRTALRGGNTGSTSGSTGSSPSGAGATSGTTSTGAAPPVGSINERVAQATRDYMGTSTRSGPDGGNLACAWAVNNILAKAGLQKVGANTNGVASVEQSLQNGRGTRISTSEARPGDIVIFPKPRSHIGIMSDNGQVANNSSSKARFSNMTALPAGSHVYRLNS